MSTLTGRRRYRIGGLFRTKLILQVEERRSSVCPYTFQDSPFFFVWRDAGAEDLMIIQACHAPSPIAERTAS